MKITKTKLKELYKEYEEYCYDSFRYYGATQDSFETLKRYPNVCDDEAEFAGVKVFCKWLADKCEE